MGVMKDKCYEIETLFIDGLTVIEIATELEVPTKLVEDVLKTFGVDIRDLQDEPYSPYYGA